MADADGDNYGFRQVFGRLHTLPPPELTPTPDPMTKKERIRGQRAAKMLVRIHTTPSSNIPLERIQDAQHTVQHTLQLLGCESTDVSLPLSPHTLETLQTLCQASSSASAPTTASPDFETLLQTQSGRILERETTHVLDRVPKEEEDTMLQHHPTLCDEDAEAMGRCYPSEGEEWTCLPNWWDHPVHVPHPSILMRVWTDQEREAADNVVSGKERLEDAVARVPSLAYRALGFGLTAGTIVTTPLPSRQVLIASFEAPLYQAKQDNGMTTGARAWAKHVERDDSGRWPPFQGSIPEMNAQAVAIAHNILDTVLWLNTHLLPHGVAVLEIRSTHGRGLRFLADGSIFIGFLEPHKVVVADDEE